MRRRALGLVARRRLRAASMRCDPLLALLVAFVLETFGLVLVHVHLRSLHWRTWRATSEVVEDAPRRPAQDAFFVGGGDLERLDARYRALDRSEEVRVVAAHHHVIGADQLARKPERRRAEGHGVVIQTLEIDARQLVDVDAALREVAIAIVHALHQVRHGAAEMTEDPT